MIRSEEIGKRYEELSRFTVWQALEGTAGRLPAKTAVVDGARRLTFAGLLRNADRLARALAGQGLRKGDVAAVYMKTSAELVTIFYALQRLGVVVAWINPSYRETEVRFILQDSGARTVFVFEQWQEFSYLGAIEALRPVLPELETVIFVPDGPGAASGKGALPLPELLEGVRGGAANLPPEAQPDDLSMLLYTSGTTGPPKGAMVRQSQAVRGAWSYSLAVEATEGDVFLGFLPMTHSFGCGALLVQPVLLGATVVLLDRFSSQAAFALIEQERCTLQLGAPAHFLLELRDDRRRSYDLGSLRAGLTGGQIVPEGMISRVQEELGMYLSSILGASEVGPGISLFLPFGAPLEVREKYVGFPVEGTSAKVVDPETGAEPAPGEPGELLLSGWHVVQGYWKNPEATALQLRGGWLRTGDLAARGPDGCFRILGRLKECINRGGLKIIPSEVEGLLSQHPGVEEVCVVGTPNPVLGESVAACVRSREGDKPPTLEELRAFLHGKVASHKLPDELLVLDEFPRLPGGLKVNRFGNGGVLEIARGASLRRQKADGPG